jgi:hypothetical protein
LRRVEAHAVGFGQVCQNGAPARLLIQTAAHVHIIFMFT